MLTVFYFEPPTFRKMWTYCNKWCCDQDLLDGKSRIKGGRMLMELHHMHTTM